MNRLTQVEGERARQYCIPRCAVPPLLPPPAMLCIPCPWCKLPLASVLCHQISPVCSPITLPSNRPSERAPCTGPLLQAWRQQLLALQPLVQLEDAVLLGAVELVKELAASRPDLAPTLHASVPHLYTYLAAGVRRQGLQWSAGAGARDACWGAGVMAEAGAPLASVALRTDCCSPFPPLPRLQRSGWRPSSAGCAPPSPTALS